MENFSGLSGEATRLVKQNFPCYHFDAKVLIRNIQTMRERFEKRSEICYSVKSNPLMVKYAAEVADCVEVCSAGELQLCEEAGISPSKIVVGGIYKSDEELDYISRKQYRRISVESLRELDTLARAAARYMVVQKVLLRLSSGNQFGIREDELLEAVDCFERYPYIRFCGIHYYSGTQKKKSSDIEKDLNFLKQVINRLGLSNPHIEYGPGIGFPALIEGSDWYNSLCEEIVQLLVPFCKEYFVTLEMGRVVTSDIGCYITKIVDIKERGKNLFYIVNGGIHHISYYGQVNGSRCPYIRYLDKKNTRNTQVTICGELCTANDIIAKNAVIPTGEIGDFLVFENVGAYSVTEARSLFLSHPMPAVLISDHDQTYVARTHNDTYKVNMSGNFD